MPSKKLRYLLALSIFYLALVASANAQFTYITSRVIDGDTFTARHFGSDSVYKVRMSYIDAPEMKQPFGKEAKEYLAHLLLNEPLQLTIKGHDRYGRILAIVKTQRVHNVNETMVEKGYAWWYLPGKALKNTYMPLQKYARSKKAGIWKQKQPTPPWIFRKQSH